MCLATAELTAVVSAGVKTTSLSLSRELPALRMGGSTPNTKPGLQWHFGQETSSLEMSHKLNSANRDDSLDIPWPTPPLPPKQRQVPGSFTTCGRSDGNVGLHARPPEHHSP
ncbi:hypothetical protein SCARD494_05834 [Seiridium cardinale]